MTKRETRYCTSPDGTRIAYTIFGELGSAPSVSVFPWFMTTEHALQFPHLRAWHESMAASAQHVAYDRRGTGASQREIVDCSLEAHLEDLAAVVESARLDSFNVVGLGGEGSVVAAAYLATHALAAERAVLSGFHPCGSQLWRTDAESLIQMICNSWPLAVRVISELAWSQSSPLRRREHARIFARSCSSDVAARYTEFWSTYDIRELLPRVSVPTLVTLIPGSHRMKDEARAGAAAIPDVRFVELEGETEDEYISEELHHCLSFLGQGGAIATPGAVASARAGTAIILFADIVDSTALTERMGDAAFRERARALEEALRGIISSAGGTAIDGKLLGDGVLATFPAASQAIDAALRCGSAGDEQSLPLHLGLHAGDVIREQNNVFGGAVNIASRISGLSEPGEVLVSDVVRALARTSASVTFEDRGEHALKGVGEPQRVYAVRREGGA